MLFIIDANGVPSVARMVSVGVAAPAVTPPVKPPAKPVSKPTVVAPVCHPWLSAPRRVRAGTRLVLRFRACRAGSLTATLQRRRGAARRRVVTRSDKHVRTAGRGRLRLSLHAVRPGRYRLRARLTGGRRVTLSRVVVVTRRLR